LTSGRTFVVDIEQCTLVEVDRSSNFTDLNRFDQTPRAISVDPKEERLVISSGTEIHVLFIYPSFKLNKITETGIYFDCVYFLNEHFICSYGKKIVIINSGGETARELDGLSKEPNLFALSHDGKRVYYIKRNTVVCHEVDGNLVFQQEIYFSEASHAMALDDWGNLYVCDDRKDGSVVQISNDREKIRSLMHFQATQKESVKRDSESDKNDSDTDGSESDDGYQKITRTICFDTIGKKFLICSQSNTVELFEIN
jgi:hypothetical protein